MARGVAVVCNNCEFSDDVVIGALMMGIEVLPCACRSCQRFVHLERDLIRDEPPPEQVCPDCDGPVEPIAVHGERIVEQEPDYWQHPDRWLEPEAPPLNEPPPVGCPLCGGELHGELTVLAD